MNGNILERLIEHNNWANLCIIKACSSLSDEQLDAEPQTVTKGSIRLTLLHLVSSQRGYLALLTLPVETRRLAPPAIADLQESARISGEGLLALARDWPNQSSETQLQTTDGYFVAPWVVMLQVINHATEHREQIKSMLTALGVKPPRVDGWEYGKVTGALAKIGEGE